MSLPILQTKLYAPKHQRQKNVVPRPRLTEKLTANLVGKVTLISAPAGFGKSTLLREWIADLRLMMDDRGTVGQAIVNQQSSISNHITWLALDSDDNDPIRFLTYLIA